MKPKFLKSFAIAAFFMGTVFGGYVSNLPFEIRQAWIMTGKTPDMQSDESFNFQIVNVIDPSAYGNEDDEGYFLDKDEIVFFDRKDMVTINGTRLAPYGIVYDPKSDSAVAAVKDFDNQNKDRFCMIEKASIQEVGLLEGKYFTGNDFKEYTKDKNYSHFGKCTLRRL